MGSSSNENFNKQKRTAQEVSEQETNADVIYGVIQYGRTAEVQKSLEEKLKKEAFGLFLDSLSWNSVGEALLESLQLANVSFTKYGRPNARRILLVFSDRPWNDSVVVSEIGGKMRDTGVKIVTVSVGNKSDDEQLSELAGRKPLKVDEDTEPEETGKKVSEEIMKGRVTHQYQRTMIIW